MVGIVSLLIWALFMTVTFKYVFFLMRADNKGEGGTLSLMALAQKAIGRRSKTIFLLGVAGAALFSGDAIITPAISVLSAVEGLNTASQLLPALCAADRRGDSHHALSLPEQRHGEGRPVFWPDHGGFLWPDRLSRRYHIADAPRILHAFNPFNGLIFLFSHGSTGFVTLGLVFLAVTGAEALYADMGHFGRKPIQIAWLFFVLPSLVCNYLGQGALVLKDPAAVKDPFFLMAPNGR